MPVAMKTAPTPAAVQQEMMFGWQRWGQVICFMIKRPSVQLIFITKMVHLQKCKKKTQQKTNCIFLSGCSFWTCFFGVVLNFRKHHSAFAGYCSVQRVRRARCSGGFYPIFEFWLWTFLFHSFFFKIYKFYSPKSKLAFNHQVTQSGNNDALIWSVILYFCMWSVNSKVNYGQFKWTEYAIILQIHSS